MARCSAAVAAALLTAVPAFAEVAHASSGSSRSAVKESITPLQKVIEMLSEMNAKGRKEKHTEEVEFAEFQQWCDSTRDTTKKSIADNTAKITQLEADIVKAEADAEQNGQEAEDYSAKADADQSELDAATAIRKKEKADYDATYADLSESIDAIERAISVLKARGADTPQSLIQLRSSTAIPAETKNAIEALLSMNQTPAANGYEFQSGSVVDMLEKLRLKFQDERLALEKAEMAAKANYQVLAQKLTASIADGKKRASDRTATKAQRLEDAAKAKGDLAMTKDAKAEDEKTLSETLSSCELRSQEFENNQVVRAGEIKAIEKATEILSSDAVTGNADKYLPASAASAAASSFVQLRAGQMPEVPTDARGRAVEFLQSRAKELSSRYLAVVAHSMAEDPFAKVKTMIKDLIVKLMEEANSEADHNAYCTTELATNKQTRENKQAEVDELNANIEQKTAESAKLATEIADLSEAVSALKAQQAEATKLRQEEKDVNTVTIADAKESQVAVERATKVLKDYYASVASASSASLLQGEISQEMDQATKAPYNGMQSESGGIIGFLEVVLSDFARLEAETSSAEQAAQEAYDSFMAETNQDVAVKETEIKHKTGGKDDTDANIESLKKELELTQEELSAAFEYFEKLKPDCVAKGLSYEERVQKREEEIQSLQEALKILTQEDLA